MEPFVFALMVLTGTIAFRYGLVHVQSRRAISLAGKKSVDHIMKCDEAFKIIHNFKGISEDDRKELLATVHKALEQHDMYFDEYYKDFNFNDLWLDPTKWTLRQMYPHLVNLETLTVVIDGEEI